MNEGVQGLFSGIGNAMAETGQQGVNDYFQKSRLNLRQKLNAESAEKDREFQKDQAKTQDQRERERLRLQAKLNKEGQQSNWEDVTDDQGNIVGQRNAETNQYQPLKQGDTKMDPRVEYQLDRVSDEVDHLWEMERRIRTGATGDFGEIGVVTDNNRDEVLEDVRARIESNERQMNQLLGNTAPGDPTQKIIEKAGEVPEGDRDEFLEDLRNDGRVPDEVIQRIQQSWDATGQQEQPSQQREGGEGDQSQGREQPREGQPQQEQPRQQGSGLLQQFLQGQGGQGEPQVPLRAGQQAEQPEQGAEQSQDERQSQAAEQQGGVQDNRLGPAIERGISSMMNWPNRLDQAQKKRSISNMEEIARKGGTETEQEKNQFLGQDLKYVNELSPELQNRLIEIFGEEAIQPYLNQE